ncbi:hypothetical protein EB796_003936 [Bugula neritina]|uniref:Uncharacterized protein n=1 Tax=Bugula neritina TaxID=10212 RepID=A0A7J7KGF8_BUGNE|nr:hypothetical protein EB796_003936 [Bugula neritina]
MLYLQTTIIYLYLVNKVSYSIQCNRVIYIIIALRSQVTSVYVHKSGGWRSVYILLHSLSTNESDQVLNIIIL